MRIIIIDAVLPTKYHLGQVQKLEYAAMTLKVSFSANEKFIEELDRAVAQHRRANPHRNCSRSTFMRDAVERAMTSTGAAPAPRVRTRERSGAAA